MRIVLFCSLLALTVGTPAVADDAEAPAAATSLADDAGAAPATATSGPAASPAKAEACKTARVDLFSAALPMLGGVESQALCQADCGDLIIQCNGSRCSAADRNCPDEQGFVECDGEFTYCGDECTPVCGDGDCEFGEADTCPSDCCGDGICQFDEAATCPTDCCGDGICQRGEEVSCDGVDCCFPCIACPCDSEF